MDDSASRPNPPERRTSRPGAGTHRKRAATLAGEAREGLIQSQKAKKPRRRAPTINISSSPPPPPRDLEVEEEEQEEQEEEDLEEEEEEAQELEYRGTWRALVNRKLALSGSQTGKWLQSYLSKERLYNWQLESHITYLGNMTLSYRFTEAVITYEHCRTKDELECDIKDGDNLHTVYESLQEIANRGYQPILRLTCHFNGVVDSTPGRSQSTARTTGQIPRQTATQRQLSALGEVVQSEVVTGNPGPLITEKWVCRSSQCKNKGKICWVKGTILRDNPRNHYPISGELMRRWSREVSEQASTIEEPSSKLVTEFVEEKAERRNRSTALKAKKDTGSSSEKLFEQILKISMVNMMNQQTPRQSPTGSPSTTSVVPLVAPSSPIRSSIDPEEVLHQFFEWYIEHHAPQQRTTMEAICTRLIEEDWTLDSLRTEAKGGAITQSLWQGFGFRSGTLVKIQEKISAFKRYRGSASSHGSTSNEE
jgi:hypothetical protein